LAAGKASKKSQKQMDRQISVESAGENVFHVAVAEGASKTTHRVTVQPKDYDRITAGKISAEQLVKMSFEFLLAHEPKESILSSFDLMVIARYFPSFKRDLQTRING
jgi:hypothetical protein